MCGIAGFYESQRSSSGTEDRASIVDRMTNTLRHRGPDGHGHFVSDRCALGHRRLKIIDLSERARQPMTDRDGHVVVSFNGEIYNHRDLRRELEPKYQFRSGSDTEVIVHGYREWGLGVFERLNGMFAIALWDVTNETLVLARDRLGKKPLFYFWDGRECAFGSELKAVLAYPKVTAEIDPQSLVQYLAFGYVPTPRSIFRNTWKVPQGAYVAFRGATKTSSAFWRLTNRGIRIEEGEALEELDRLLTASVSSRLESDVPLGFLLSGGVDSSLVTSIGQKLCGDLHTFSVGFHSPEYDEAPFALEVARHLGTRHEELYLDENAFSAFIDRAPDYYDEPFADSSCIASYCLSRLTRQHVTVAVGGDGGDELFCGYPKYRDLGRAEQFLRLPRAARWALTALGKSVPHRKINKIARAVESGGPEEISRWIVSIWKEDELRRLIPGVTVDWASTTFSDAMSGFSDSAPIPRLMAVDVRTYLCDDILQKMDRASMAVGLEVRSPLLDYHVVEFAQSLPFELKLRDGTPKYLLKRLLERYVPRALWERPKQGLCVPLKHWYRGQRRASILAMVEPLAQAHPVLSAEAMRYVVHEHVNGRADYSQKIFALDMLNLWTARQGAAMPASESCAS